MSLVKPIFSLFVLAITAEAFGEYAESLVDWRKNGERKKFTIQMGILILSIFLCIIITSGNGLYSHLGIHFRVPLVDEVLTGIVVSRGSNYLSDIMNKINTFIK